MKFLPVHLNFFNAKEGAFSQVTGRENFDSQITLTDFEAEILLNYFGGDNILVGNVQSDKKKAAKKFKLYGTQTKIKLNVNYPKINKPELRLYLSKREGFKPEEEEIWFLFVDNNDELVIGSMKNYEWDNIGQDDEFDDEYVNEIDETLNPESVKVADPIGEIIKVTVSGRTTFKRNPLLAVMRFEEASYKCEIDPEHQTFTSIRSGKPFVEAHHFIPMKFQDRYDFPLDNLHNLISLCPNCHRAFHHASIDEKVSLIRKIYDIRPAIRETFSIDEIEGFYNCVKLSE